MNFPELILTLHKINEELREESIRAINISLTLRNWIFGFYIVEFEQNGNDRAEYGKALLATIATEMKNRHIANVDERELRRYRQFYLSYPAISSLILKNKRIRELLPPGLAKGNMITTKSSFRRLSTPELYIPDNHHFNLISNISYTHFVELIRIEEPLKRLFYELECVKGTWSVKELKRQIGSLLYERTGLSKDKDKLKALAHSKSQINTFPDIIRDPYIFEFIGLKREEVLPEKEMGKALLDYLLEFLLELGKGFCFEARQKRIVIDNEHHFIDLVFYHRLLHCNILIELKTERFNYTHVGQLNMYLEYYKKYERVEGDNPPIGILLCTDKKELEQFIKMELRNK